MDPIPPPPRFVAICRRPSCSSSVSALDQFCAQHTIDQRGARNQVQSSSQHQVHGTAPGGSSSFPGDGQLPPVSSPFSGEKRTNEAGVVNQMNESATSRPSFLPINSRSSLAPPKPATKTARKSTPNLPSRRTHGNGLTLGIRGRGQPSSSRNGIYTFSPQPSQFSPSHLAEKHPVVDRSRPTDNFSPHPGEGTEPLALQGTRVEQQGIGTVRATPPNAQPSDGDARGSPGDRGTPGATPAKEAAEAAEELYIDVEFLKQMKARATEWHERQRQKSAAAGPHEGIHAVEGRVSPSTEAQRRQPMTSSDSSGRKRSHPSPDPLGSPGVSSTSTSKKVTTESTRQAPAPLPYEEFHFSKGFCMVRRTAQNTTARRTSALSSDRAISKKSGKAPTRAPHVPASEQRRLRRIAGFDQLKFDVAFYHQEGASTPPSGVTLPTEPQRSSPPPEEDGRLYLHLDPRIHWAREWTDEWYRAKMAEVKARGRRKANFGRAAARMREQRLREEQEELEAASPAPPTREPRPWSHERPISFGDVPADELPEFVTENKEWVKACAWMRSNRERTTERHRKVERRQALGRSVQDLLGPTGW